MLSLKRSSIMTPKQRTVRPEIVTCLAEVRVLSIIKPNPQEFINLTNTWTGSQRSKSTPTYRHHLALLRWTVHYVTLFLTSTVSSFKTFPLWIDNCWPHRKLSLPYTSSLLLECFLTQVTFIHSFKPCKKILAWETQTYCTSSFDKGIFSCHMQPPEV